MHPIGQTCIYIWAVATLIAFVSAIVFLIRLITKKNRKTVKRVFWIATAVAISSFVLYGVTSPVTRCDHEFITIVDQQPTCTEDGKKEQYCPLCEFTNKETIKATGHQMETKSKIEPTYESDGEQIDVCSVCGYEVVTKIDMLVKETTIQDTTTTTTTTIEHTQKTSTERPTTETTTTKETTATVINVCWLCNKDAVGVVLDRDNLQIINYCSEHSDLAHHLFGYTNWHSCEECSREGIYEYESFTGETEYYCSRHYEELLEMLKELGIN